MIEETTNSTKSIRPAKVTLKRIDRLRFGSGTFAVFVDDTDSQALRAEETLEFLLPPGRHTLRIETDGFSCTTLSIDLAANRSYRYGVYRHPFLGVRVERDDDRDVIDRHAPRTQTDDINRYGVALVVIAIVLFILFYSIYGDYFLGFRS